MPAHTLLIRIIDRSRNLARLVYGYIYTRSPEVKTNLPCYHKSNETLPE